MKINPVLIGTLAVASTIGANAANIENVASVDLARVFREFWQTNQAQEKVDEQKAKVQAENQKRLDALKTIEEELLALKKKFEDPSLNEKSKKEIAEQFQAKNQDGVAKDRERQDYLKRKEKVLQEQFLGERKTILDNIQKEINKQAEEGKFDVVFDQSSVSATGTNIFLFTAKKFDITEQVIKKLNKDAPEKYLKKAEEQTPIEIPASPVAPAAPANN